MDKQHTIDITANYPYPISEMCRKYLRIEDDKLNEKHSLLCDIFESLIKFIAVVCLQESPKRILKDVFPQGLDFLKHPSLGHWVSIIRELSKKEWEGEELFLEDISRWYKNEKPAKEVREQYRNISELNFRKGFSLVEGVVNSLVEYRNKVWKGHGATIVDDESLRNRIPALEHLIITLLERAGFLSRMNVFFVSEVKKIDQSKQEANCISLVGSDLSAATHRYAEFDRHEIYLAYSLEKDLARKPILLSPLVEWQMSESGEQDFFFLNDVKRSKLEYLSYVDSSYYYHREIKRTLNNIISVSLETTDEDIDYIIYNSTEVQRKERSEYFYRKGRELASKENWEGAIVSFEDALEWYRRPEIVVEMCESMHELGDDGEYVQTVLESAFEMNPNYGPAISLKARIDAQGTKITDIYTLNGQSECIEYYTYFDVLVPDLLRPHGALVVSAITAAALFGVTFLFILHRNQFSPATLYLGPLALIQILTPIIVIAYSKEKYVDSYYLLEEQIKNIRGENFEKFYRSFYKKIFGDFVRHSGINEDGTEEKVPLLDVKDCKELEVEKGIWGGLGYLLRRLSSYSVRPNMKGERNFVIVSVLVSVGVTVTLVTSQDVPLGFTGPIILLRTYCNLVFWFVMVLTFRYLFGVTSLIGEYSNKELSPVVSRETGFSGFQAITKLFLANVLVINLFWASNVYLNMCLLTMSARPPMYTDVFAFAGGYLLILTWTILTPRNIRRGLVNSKVHYVKEYNLHLKGAFESFVNNPGEVGLERLNWLVKNTRSVTRVSTRLFTIWQWLILIVTNLIALGCTALYVLYRVGFVEIPFL